MSAARSPSTAGTLPFGPLHGFHDDAATRRLLRSRPPGAALASAKAQLW
jgi:hypothetical protein